MMTKGEPARQAIHLEQTLLKEDVGIQDQILMAYDGLNVAELSLHQKFLDALDEFLLVPFELGNAGAYITFYEPKHYSQNTSCNSDFVR